MYIIQREKCLGGGYLANDDYKSSYAKYAKYAKVFKTRKEALNVYDSNSEIILEIDELTPKKRKAVRRSNGL